jgi:hypothetical protein
MAANVARTTEAERWILLDQSIRFGCDVQQITDSRQVRTGTKLDRSLDSQGELTMTLEVLPDPGELQRRENVGCQECLPVA